MFAELVNVDGLKVRLVALLFAFIVLQAMRVLRILRFAHLVPPFRVIVETLTAVIPELRPVALFLLCVLLEFTFIGNRTDRPHFIKFLFLFKQKLGMDIFGG